jgi:archaeal flagellar protein FlaJ
MPDHMPFMKAIMAGNGPVDLRTLVKSRGIPVVAIASLASGSIVAGILSLLSIGLEVTSFVLLMVALVPVAYAHRIVSQYDAEVEAKAPEFFYDLSEQVKASGSITRALKRITRHEYGIISGEVSCILSEVEDEGYDIATALQAMARRVNNRYIDRSVSVIREALTTSSKMESILKMVAEDGRLAQSLKKEKLAGVSSSVFVFYFTAVIFLILMMLCLTSFMHLAGEMGRTASPDETASEGSIMPYYILSVSVAVCTGLTVGEMRDATIFGGFKDATALLLLTFIVYELAIFPGISLLGAFGA